MAFLFEWKGYCALFFFPLLLISVLKNRCWILVLLKQFASEVPIVGREGLALHAVGAGLGSGTSPRAARPARRVSPGLSCVRAAGARPGMMSSLPHRRREPAGAAGAPGDAAGTLCSRPADEILCFRYSAFISMTRCVPQTYKWSIRSWIDAQSSYFAWRDTSDGVFPLYVGSLLNSIAVTLFPENIDWLMENAHYNIYTHIYVCFLLI